MRCVNCSVRVHTILYIVIDFRGDQFYVDFVRFLIHEDLYTWCLGYNICSTWFLDIRISTGYIPYNGLFSNEFYFRIFQRAPLLRK